MDGFQLREIVLKTEGSSFQQTTRTPNSWTEQSKLGSGK